MVRDFEEVGFGKFFDVGFDGGMCGWRLGAAKETGELGDGVGCPPRPRPRKPWNPWNPRKL